MKLVRVPLRISLVGGGSDVPSHFQTHGGAVLSCTIDKYIYISAKLNTSLFPNRYRLVYSTVEECNERRDIKHPIIRQLCHDYGLGCLDLDVMSDIPAGTGMGSSSAFTVGMHMALSGGARLAPAADKHRLAELACATEITDLKEPIGMQDQYAAAFGGINYIQFNNTKQVSVLPILLDSEAEFNFLRMLRLVYVGGTRSASEQLKQQQAVPNYFELIEMQALAQSLRDAIFRNEWDLVGPLVLAGWKIKKKLSPTVSTPEIDTLIDTALAHGATGGKLLGAGGAGFVLLVCPPKDMHKMEEGLKHLNPNYVSFKLDHEGAKVLYEG